MQTFTFLQLVVFSILNGVSPSNALFADPEQAQPKELDRLALTASHPVVWIVAIIIMAVLSRNICYLLH